MSCRAHLGASKLTITALSWKLHLCWTLLPPAEGAVVSLAFARAGHNPRGNTNDQSQQQRAGESSICQFEYVI